MLVGDIVKIWDEHLFSGWSEINIKFKVGSCSSNCSYKMTDRTEVLQQTADSPGYHIRTKIIKNKIKIKIKERRAKLAGEFF